MIKILVEKSSHQIKQIDISGHAQAGPKGYDLVCAAVSSIATGALNALDDLYPHQCQLILQEKPAQIMIKVLKASQEVQTLLEIILIQLKTVEQAHPEHIRIKE
jgi:uncharacterized protein